MQLEQGGSEQTRLVTHRVLDVTQKYGYLCGKMLADMGADVVKVEPPDGDPGRRMGPYYHGIADPEKSLYWLSYNNNKRGITLNLEHPDGRQLFKQLVRQSDVLIESYPPGYLRSLGLDYPALREINRGLVMASITGFGQTGPYANFKAPDIVVAAMSGQMFQTGEPDRTPLRIGVPQSYLNAAADAAVGICVALWHRRQTGEGQHVDASAQHSMLWFTASGIPHWMIQGVLLKRVGLRRVGFAAGKEVRQLWPCKDGYVAFVVVGGLSGARSNRPLTQWMAEEGFADDFLLSIDWNQFDMAKATPEMMAAIEERIGKFFLSRNKMDLYQGAIQRHVMLYPAAEPPDLMADEQLQCRGFWNDVPHPELGTTIRYPGPALKSSAVEVAIRRRPPLIGEHNEEIYGDLGISPERLAALKQAGAI